MTDIKIYEKQHWQDHIVERPGAFVEVDLGNDLILHVPDEGEILQQGSQHSERRMNHMEEGIYNASFQAVRNKEDILSLAIEVAILKNASLNNITHNIFMVNFVTLDDVRLIHGVYDEQQKRLVI